MAEQHKEKKLNSNTLFTLVSLIDQLPAQDFFSIKGGDLFKDLFNLVVAEEKFGIESGIEILD